MSDTKFISPEEYENRQKRRRKTSTIEEESSSHKFFNKAGCVGITYESEGRFSAPETLYFRGFTMADVNDIILSRQEDVIENIVVVLNRCLNKDDGNTFDCADLTIEEAYETFVALKRQFDNNIHIHRWVCDCQTKMSEEDRIINEEEINLDTLKYISISETESNIREYIKQELLELDEEDLNNYLYTKYGEGFDRDSWTIEKEMETIVIAEPIVQNIEDHIYRFRFPRIGDLVLAQKYAYKEYAPKITKVERRQEHGVPLAELKEKKKQEIEKLEYEREKLIILYAKALSLLSIDGREISDKEKLEVYAHTLNSNKLMDLERFIDEVAFGIHDEREFTCPICGKISKRCLQQELDLLDLLPFNTTSNRKRKKFTQLNIHFGA